MSRSNALELKRQTRTPRPVPDGYDWRKEPWVADESTRALSHYIAAHILVALQTAGDDEADERDNVALSLLCPEMTELVWKSPSADEVLDYRLLCAATMGIDKLISRWMDRFGSVDAGGPTSEPVSGTVDA